MEESEGESVGVNVPTAAANNKVSLQEARGNDWVILIWWVIKGVFKINYSLLIVSSMIMSHGHFIIYKW